MKHILEWRVDSDAKEEIIKKSAKDFQSMVNKNKTLANCVRIMQPEKISQYNLNLWDIWRNKNNYTNKRRTIMIGAYSFDGKAGANFVDLSDIIESFNFKNTDIKITVGSAPEDTMEAIFFNMLIPGLGPAVKYNKISKRGVIKLSIKKKAIKESTDNLVF